MRKIVLSSFFVMPLFLLLFKDGLAFRCSELMYQSFEQRFEFADVIFTGKAIKLIPTEYSYDVAVFNITHSWKGITSHTIKGISSAGFGEGHIFQVGEEYLIFGFRDRTKPEFFTADCSPASLISLSTDDLLKLQSIPELHLDNPPLDNRLVLSFIISLFTLLITPTIFARKRTSS